jgi:hypothetical protein
MSNTHHRLAVLSTLLCTAVLLQACGNRSSISTSTSSEHIRGTVQSLDGRVLTVATSTGSERVQLPPTILVNTVVQSDRAHITDGTFLGIVSVTQPDGSQRAVEVTVIPEEMRGTGEGSYPWDLQGRNGGRSKMTNGTVAPSRMTNGTVSSSKMTNGTVTAQGGGSSLTVQYKDGTSTGSQTITVPPDIPVVGIEPGHSADLQPGVHVVVIAHRDSEGMLTADRVLAGRNGVVPPM